MNDAEFKAAAKEAARSVHMDAVRAMSEAVNATDPDPDLVVKVYNATKDVAEAVPDKKADPRAGLATFQITFVGGSTQVAAQSLPLVEVVREVQPVPLLDAVTPLALPTPRPMVIPAIAVDLDKSLDELLEGLDL